jgi:gamma-tubulin complex component 2
MCENAIKIREFIRFQSRYEFGLVSHAVVAVMKAIMREFDTLIAQLEHLLILNKLTIQKLTYLLHPSKATLSTLVQLTSSLRDASGGLLLDRLHTGMLAQGDSRARDLYSHILQKAYQPFLSMLSEWVFRYVCICVWYIYIYIYI